ncbi:MAG: methionyl-tRNA formyltransferase [Anaerolineae bacterium]|jgi:methionyl-tRNA formyltransferase|nr:methionyl-tRNA formyltransferase [Anaerolineae bacterium]
MAKYRVVFMGSGDFGIPALQALHQQSWGELVALVTQPDKPAGRGMKLRPAPIKEAAMALGIPVLQPVRLRTAESIEAIRALAPDVIVVAAYGQWIPPEVFAAPPFRSLNIHPSLLPRHRGAAPVMSAILAGDRETGVTIILVAEEMDAGDILSQVSLPILPDDTTGSLMRKLADLGAALIVETLPRWLAGQIQPVPQDHSKATWFRQVSKEAGLIDWTEPAEVIWRKVRAFNPWPSAYTFLNGRRLIVHRAMPMPGGRPQPPAPGEVAIYPQGPAVGTGTTPLLLLEVQLEGKKRISGKEFLAGQRGLAGMRLG